jgi:hypothetical protein
MKRVLAAVLVVCLAVPVIAIEVTMTDDEQEACDTQGGCVFATRHHLADLLRQAFDQGVKRGQEKCSA